MQKTDAHSGLSRTIIIGAGLCAATGVGALVYALYITKKKSEITQHPTPELKVPQIVLPASTSSTLSEADLSESYMDITETETLDVVNNNDNDDLSDDDEDDRTMSPEQFLNFISSRVKMQDPVTNHTIYPLVSMLELPEAHFEYNCVAKVNNVHRGVLNFVLKQAAELERFLSKFSIENFPIQSRKIIRLLQNAPDMKAKEYLNSLDKQIMSGPSLKTLTTELQIMVLDFLREYLSEDHYVGELVDNRGRTRSVWRVYNRLGGEEAMITPFGSALNKPTEQISRPFREIVSISFAALTAVSSKMKKTVMAGDWSSTCSSSSKLSH